VSYFLFTGVIQPGHPFQLEGEEASHILNSRRILPGELIQVQDQKELRYSVRVDSVGKQKLALNPLLEVQTPPASPLRIHLWQALVKEKAVDIIIQKSTELGVASICFFQSRYSQRLHAKSEISSRTQRWRKIAVEACKQCGRVRPPDISFKPDPIEFDQVSGESSIKTIPVLCLESLPDAVPLDATLKDVQDIALMVGPEGGWAPEDLKGLPFRKVSLGPRILRSETAAIAAVSILQFRYGDLRGTAAVD